MSLTTSEVPVLYADLENVQQVLGTMLNNLHAQDLVDQYRKLDNRNRRSPLTRLVEDAYQRVSAYLEEAKAVEEPEDDELPE